MGRHATDLVTIAILILMHVSIFRFYQGCKLIINLQNICKSKCNNHDSFRSSHFPLCHSTWCSDFISQRSLIGARLLAWRNHKQLGPHDLTLKCTKTLDTIYSPDLNTNLSISWIKTTAVLQRLSLWWLQSPLEPSIQEVHRKMTGQQLNQTDHDNQKRVTPLVYHSSHLWTMSPFASCGVTAVSVWFYRRCSQPYQWAPSQPMESSQVSLEILQALDFSPKYTVYSAVPFVVKLLNIIFQAWKIIPVSLNKERHKTESWCMLLFQSTGVTLISRSSSACSRKP